MKKSLLVVVTLLIIALGFYLYKKSGEHQQTQQKTLAQESEEKTIGRIGEAYFNFEIADNDNERTKGLSGRDQLADTESLLFVFESPDNHCFWMKDMKFNIDILWFDADKKLIYEKRNLSPDTYPQKYCPDVPAKYVAEVTAGAAEKNQLKLGDKLDIEL